MSIRVLLVEDHQIVREGLRVLLNRTEDIEVVAEAATGAEAVKKALELTPDVVVMDLTLPEISGIEATRRIIAADPDRMVLILSMQQDKDCVMESLKAGAKGYLVKSCAAEELCLAIHSLAAGKAYLCSQITDLVIQSYTDSDSEDETSVAHSILTARELEVLRLITAGQSTKEIAFALNISIKTIDVHRSRIMKKLDLHSVAELTKYAVREGLTPLK